MFEQIKHALFRDKNSKICKNIRNKLHKFQLSIFQNGFLHHSAML